MDWNLILFIIGNKPEEFFAKLEPLGFEIDVKPDADANGVRPTLPAFFTIIKPGDVIEFDVRPIIDAGNDPLRLITEKVKALPRGGVLKIINCFEPTQLILLLKKQSFEYYADTINDELVETYFYKKDGAEISLDETTHISHMMEVIAKYICC